MSQHFNVTHSLIFSSITPSGYRFGANFIGTKRVGLLEKYPVLRGEIMPNGNLTATMMHTLGCRWRLKLGAQIETKEYKAFSSTIEYRSNDFTASLTVADPNIFKQHGTFVFHYLQAITPRITLGAELVCRRGKEIPGYQQSFVSLAYRYSTGTKTFSTTFSKAGIHWCYHMKASSQLQLGLDFETNFRTRQTESTIIYQTDFPNLDLTFRGSLNSETTVAGVFEKRLFPSVNSSLLISALYNHKKEHFRVGVGLNIG